MGFNYDAGKDKLIPLPQDTLRVKQPLSNPNNTDANASLFGFKREPVNALKIEPQQTNPGDLIIEPEVSRRVTFDIIKNDGYVEPTTVGSVPVDGFQVSTMQEVADAPLKRTIQLAKAEQEDRLILQSDNELTAGSETDSAKSKPPTFFDGIRRAMGPQTRSNKSAKDLVAEAFPEWTEEKINEVAKKMEESFIEAWMKEHNCSRKEAIRQMEQYDKNKQRVAEEKAKILNRKASNGMTYADARETIYNLRRKYEGYFAVREAHGPTSTINEERLYNFMSPEDRDLWNKAKAACEELEKDEELMKTYREAAYGEDDLGWEYRHENATKKAYG